MVPAAQSWQLGASQAVQMRPLGRDGRPTNPGECRARPSAHMVGTVTETTGREGHSRCEQGSTALLLGALSGGLTYLCRAGNVTVGPVYRRPVTSWRRIRLCPSRVRLAGAWERSQTGVVSCGVAHVLSTAAALDWGGSGHRRV